MNTLTPISAAAAAPAQGDGAARQARLLAEVALAGRAVATARPLDRFVGLNPLAGVEHLGFSGAAAAAAQSLGLRAMPDEAVLRGEFATGRISLADLRTAAVGALAATEQPDRISIDGEWVSTVELLVDDLRRGPLDAPPVRQRRTLAEATAPRLAAQIDRRTARWCAAFVDGGQAAWAMPARDRGLYGAWRALGADEPGAPQELRLALRQAPADAAQAVLDALTQLGVPDAEIRTYLESHLATQPGWAAHLRWREQAGDGVGLVDLLAIRLVQEAALLGPGAWLPSLVAPIAATPAVSPRDRATLLLGRSGRSTANAADIDAVAGVLGAIRDRRALLWLEAYEAGYRRALLADLGRAAAPLPVAPAAQLVCCIDPRSEGLRRHLEATGPYETFGFAGFFGLPITYQPLDGQSAHAQCPVPVAPTHAAAEQPRGSVRAARRNARGRRRREALSAALHAPHAGGVGAFTLAEAVGVGAGVSAAARTAAPRWAARVREQAAALLQPPVASTAHLVGASLDDQLTLAEGILRGIGLAGRCAPLIVLCGHESSTANNPFASALDCGACGGHGGTPNARAAAALLNDPQVREGLAARGLDLPASTWVLAAVHDTTTDRVRLLDTDLIPAAWHRPVAALQADLDAAGTALADERSVTLPGRAHRRVTDRSADWAQVFPEWGLAGNAALIVAPRARTRGIDLRRRTFLHSYDAAADPDGTVLELILTAPLVVAHGLSAQYFASAVDPVRLGSGTKAVHNVVGGIGVTAAAGGDLLTGLPWQSVADGDRLVHEPMRLLTLVEAPRKRVADIVARHRNVAQLVNGEWLRLLVREHPADRWMRLLDGEWLDEPSPTTTPSTPTHGA